MNTIPVDHELNTLLRLNPEFPLAVSQDNLSFYQNHFVNWHKQGSIEISVVKEGGSDGQSAESSGTGSSRRRLPDPSGNASQYPKRYRSAKCSL